MPNICAEFPYVFVHADGHRLGREHLVCAVPDFRGRKELQMKVRPPVVGSFLDARQLMPSVVVSTGQCKEDAARFAVTSPVRYGTSACRLVPLAVPPEGCSRVAA
eukprot:1160142-Pelagomonas_calceolata.AAC.41